MLRLLFWNLRRNLRMIDLLAELTFDRRIDVVVTAEEPELAVDVAQLLSSRCECTFRPRFGKFNKRVRIYARQTVTVHPPIAESHYMLVCPLTVDNKPELLVAAMHGISKLEAELVDLNEEACVAAALMRDAEVRRKHRRTILVGDFNLNPFDEGMAKARGFYGVMARADAEREVQVLKRNSYPLFYNPMWSRMGDLSPGPAGTYYRKQTSHLAHYWHTYDQVLVRAPIAACFDVGSFEVVTRIGKVDLLKNTVPNVEEGSDHLPVVVGFDLDKMKGS